MLGLLLLIVPHEANLETRTEIVEVNNVFDGEGQHVFTQLVWRDLGEVRDWRFTKKSGWPRYDWQTKCWRATWIENGVLVEVKSAVMLESFTQEDRELIERQWLPDCQRKRIVPREQ